MAQDEPDCRPENICNTGIYQNWLEFRDTFRSLIHDNISISHVQKFHYLRASLESDAALVIKSLEISSANYEVAWNTLLERYDNNKLLIHNHIKSLLYIMPLQKIQIYVSASYAETHYVQNCKNFLKLSPAERDKRARSLHLCINCLKRGHHSKVCRRGTCNKCSKKHHTLLHQEPCAQPTLSNSNPNANVENTLDVADTSVETSVTLSACGAILKQGGFQLRKFYSNNKDVLKYVDCTGSDFSVIDFGEHENAKTLGITWNPVHDKLMYKISNDFDETRISKRNILSSIAQIFDPLGLLAPCVILAKILMQRLWL
ncbi:hypothetical protein NQ317_018026 [Molorchus minor]|uniref:Uncharacterized protein n=1 Tax=Molorchus minor TaxID=1323400 RepID=A0ABQ9JTZ5_9CUCU|nr:hypothetical protein NQ317_018026 [Molorchus minor]